MAKKIQVVIDVQSESVKIASAETLTLTQQVKILRQELQKTPEGTKEFNLLVTKLNDTQDALGRVNIRGKELFGTLGLIPGPIGEIAARANSAIDALKIFGKLSVSDLKAQFTALGDDLKDVMSTIGKLTGITKVYEFALGKLSKTQGTATVTTRLLAGAFSALYAALGVGLILLLVEAGKAIYNMIDPTERQTKALQQQIEALDELAGIYDKYNEKTNLLYKLFAERYKTQKVSEEELAELEKERIQALIINSLKEAKDFEKRKIVADAFLKKKGGDLEKLTEKEREYYNSVTKLAEEAKDKAADLDLELQIAEEKILQARNATAEKAAEKRAERIAKEKQEREVALKEIDKNEREAILSLLTAREAELQKITDDYKAKIALATRYRQDTTLLEQAYQNATREKRAEYAKEDLDAQNQLSQDLIEDELNNLEQYRNIETAAAELRYAQGLTSEEEYQAALLQIKIRYSTTEDERQKAEIDFLEFAKGKQKEYEDTVKTANNAIAESYQTTVTSIGNSFIEAARFFEQGSDLQKTFAIIGVLINAAAAYGKITTSTAEAVADFTKTIATGTATAAAGAALVSNPITAVLGAFQIAAGKKAIAVGLAGIATAKKAGLAQKIGVGISAAAQIAAITSTGKSKTGGSSGAAGDPPTPTFNGTVTVPAPVIGASQASQSGTLGQTIAGAVMEGNSRSRPIQTYVVGDQITTQQQLDRRILAAAKMGS